jgi:RNA polymerase sigma-70 factor (ECF subfamily)
MGPDDAHKRFLGHFLKNRDGLSAFIWVLVRDRALAEDLLQETSVVLWEKFDAFQEGTAFGAWARQIALNLVRNARRRLAKAPLPLSDETARSVADAFERTETREGEVEWRGALEDCLHRLPPAMRQVIDRRYFRQEGLGEMASGLGRTLAGVNAALCKARGVLEECLRKSLREGVGHASPS